MKPTIVICPGSWGTVFSFQPLIEAFEARDYPVICKVIETYPTNWNPPDINPDTVHLGSEVLNPLHEEGKDIILFMHSYGGVYGPEEATDLVVIRKEAARDVLFHHHDLTLRKQPLRVFKCPVVWVPYDDDDNRYKELLGYIHTGQDRVVPLDLQKRFVATARIGRTALLGDATHCPHLQQPRKLVETVEEMVGSITG
ncbi:hypothetical protein GGS20DRAFT_583453 [Poronia punctata]|nr:hypothetical protein GGS20DRAFT_583453 [Poronia punctata]